jgi:crotonobetainyl-CoA:carnitine CoA-transferase CaiB-like acyl-CoA transferase
VLDLSRVLAAPWATQILGDLGAEVLKVERPGKGDDTRGWGPPFLQDGSARPDAAYYLCANRNKRSVAIDFARPEGAAWCGAWPRTPTSSSRISARAGLRSTGSTPRPCSRPTHA